MQSLFDDTERRPLSVSELNAQVKSALEKRFSNVWLEGEIVDFSEPSSGHWYFNLQDGRSQIKAACFKGTNWRIRFRPFDGLQVRVRGKITVYEVRGTYQILVDSLEPVGEGALKIAFEQIKAKLRGEGLFDDEHKRRLPFLPKRVGVVTSATGAAIFDILNVIARRTRTVDVVLIPATVQGENAPESVRNGILLANEFNKTATEDRKLDVLIVGRGGGSAEDLSAFNEESLARTIFASEIPIISAVGHEVDYSISDFVADLRAPTPSAAAEIVAASESDIQASISNFRTRAAHLMRLRVHAESNRLREISDSGVFRQFPDRVAGLRELNANLLSDMNEAVTNRIGDSNAVLRRLTHRLSPVRLSKQLGERNLKLGLLRQRNTAAVEAKLGANTEILKVTMAGLNALSPLAVLERGYSITRTKDGKVVRAAKRIEIGEKLTIRLANGSLDAEVKETHAGER